MCFSLARCVCHTLAPIPIQPRVDEGGPSTLKEMPQHGVRKGPLFLLPTQRHHKNRENIHQTLL